jgi:DHA2 family multidrug resistance protein
MKEQAKKPGISRHQWLTLITLMIGAFMGRLDGTIVNLALPKIISDFGITVSQASWIATAYIIANAIFIPVFGKLGDLIGMKKLNIYGIIGFTITSALAGASFNLSSMIFFRILQAITISISFPIAFSLIAYTFQDKQARATAMGIYSAVFAAAAVFGPLLGGPLIDNFSWRSVFYINIPIGIIATWMAFQFIDEPKKELRGTENFDILGSFLLAIFLGAVVLVLDQGQTWGWFSGASIICYIITLVSFIWFFNVELHTKEPVIDLKFFKIITFTAAIVTSFISFMGMVGALFLIPLFVQTYLGYSVTKSGYIFIPMAMGLMLTSSFGARLSQRIEPRYLIAFGTLVSAIMLVSFSFIDVKWTFFDISWRLFIFAAGLGLGLAPLSTAATSTIPLHEVGIASSILQLARNIAGGFGTAIFATILSNSITSHLLDLQKYSVLNTLNTQTTSVYFALLVVKANVLAFGTVFSSAFWFLLIGAISALFVIESKHDFTSDKKNEHIVEI